MTSTRRPYRRVISADADAQLQALAATAAEVAAAWDRMPRPVRWWLRRRIRKAMQ